MTPPCGWNRDKANEAYHYLVISMTVDHASWSGFIRGKYGVRCLNHNTTMLYRSRKVSASCMHGCHGVINVHPPSILNLRHCSQARVLHCATIAVVRMLLRIHILDNLMHAFKL